MAKTKDTRVARIYSHPQALAQCRKFLNEQYFNIEQVAVSSTSQAASLAAKESGTACIQDNDFNQTKFWVISKKQNNVGNKMSLVFTTKNEPGALYKILGLFSLSDINLTRIESRPAKTKLGEYMFFVDIDGDENEEKIRKTFDMIKDFCSEFRILGSY